MPFDPNNKIWELAQNPGRPKAFESKEQLWDCCLEYFEWVKHNSIKVEEETDSEKNGFTVKRESRQRAMVKQELFVSLGISADTWHRYSESNHEFSEIVQKVNDIMFGQKFTGAAAGTMNANIIARELNLAEQIHVEDKSLTPWDQLTAGTDKKDPDVTQDEA